MDKGLTDEEYRDLDKAIENQKRITDAYEKLAKDYDTLVLSMLVRQKAEIDRLNALLEIRHKIFETKCSELEIAKIEAYKEFVERLCEGKVSNDKTVIEAKVLLKEMVGDE